MNTSPDSFYWLTAPGASALGLLWLQGPATRQFFEHRGIKPAATPRHGWLKSSSGEPLDEILVAAENGGFIVSCHGGDAVRRSLEAELVAAGFSPSPAVPTLFGAHTPYAREMLGLLSRAQGELAVRMTLYALNHGEQLLSSALARYTPQSLARVATASACARFLYEPPRVQLWGTVNSGKSSLLNALCGENLAATGDEPGLTRDVIEGRFESLGVVIRVFDAPGEYADAPAPEIDSSALELARRWREEADLTLHLVPATQWRNRPAPAEKTVLIASRFDEDLDAPLEGAIGVSVNDPPSIERLRQWLARHFLGPLLELDAGDRFALNYGVRLGLTRVADGGAKAAGVMMQWLGKLPVND